MTDEEASKELFEAKREYRVAESALAAATARLNRAEDICRTIFDRRMKEAVPKMPDHYSIRAGQHYDSQGYCDNPGRGY